MGDWVAEKIYEDTMNKFEEDHYEFRQFLKNVRYLNEELIVRNPQLTKAAFMYIKRIDEALKVG